MQLRAFEHAHVILSRCVQAAGANGTILIIEPIRRRGSDTTIDLSMLVFFGGCERTIDKLAELASAHNLELKSVTAVADGRTLLEFTSAGQSVSTSSRVAGSRSGRRPRAGWDAVKA